MSSMIYTHMCDFIAYQVFVFKLILYSRVCSFYHELHKKWLLLTEIYLEFNYSIYYRSFSDIVQLSVTGWRYLNFYQLPLLKQGILLNYFHRFLIAIFAFHPDSFLLKNMFCLGFYIFILSFARKQSRI